MTKKLSNREWEALSAYLDNELKPKEQARLQSRLESDPAMREALEELHRTRLILRSQPKMRAPRNFTLTPQMVGQREPARRTPRAYPVMRFASALATILFVLVLAGDFITNTPTLVQEVDAPEAMLEMAVEGTPLPPAAALAATNAPPGAGLEMPQAQEMAAPQEEPMASPETEAFRSLAVPEEATPQPEALEAAPAEEEMPAEGEATAQTKAAPQEDAGVSPEVMADVAAPESQVGVPVWRLIEVALAVVALGTGLASLYMRRIARP